MKHIKILSGILMTILVSCTPQAEMSADMLIPQPQEITLKGDRPVRICGVRETVDTTLDMPQEGYILKVSGRKAEVTAKDCQGLARARATLAQLAGVTPAGMMDCKAFRGAVIPDVEIRDWPAFPIRGFMHDTGRNFRDVETLKKEIDLFSFYKLNVFHWHLTDNPAWRIECRAYPQLNDPRHQRKGRDEGSFYTYGQIREVIAYARERGVMIIPEIDMPGHSRYFNDTFGFGMASEQGMEVLEACLKEFMEEIPAEDCPYIHIGSDEVYIADPKGFMEFCEGVIREGGRTPVAWYPGLPSSEGTVSQVWSEAGRKAAGSEFQGLYLDSYMGYLNLGCPLVNTTSFYLHQLCSVEGYDGKALGGILCLWNDIRVDDKSRIFPHNGMPEGLLSFSQSSWGGGAGHGWDNLYLYPPKGSAAYDDLTGFEKRISHHRDMFLKEWDMRWVANAHISWDARITPDPSGTGFAPVETKAWGGCIDLNELCKVNGITPGNDRIEVELSTEIYAERDTVITAWAGFDSPARSNRMSDGIGKQGRWECSARVFSGDTEIFPPKPWNEPGKYRYHYPTWHKAPNELPYTDEQFFWTREPACIPLKAGWNRITLTCPRVFNAAIWIAAFVPVTQAEDGSVSEASGITYR